MLERTVYNKHNTGHLKGRFPAFLGEDMGVGTDIDITFPEINELKEKQRAAFWQPAEVSMEASRVGMETSDPVAVELMKLNLMFQQGLDSVASKSIGAMLLPHVTNPEVGSMIVEWSREESVHMDSYSYILRSVFEDPKEIVKEIYKDIEIHSRIEGITTVFDDLYNTHPSDPVELKKRNIARALVVLMAMEGCAFMNSFSVTFAVEEATKAMGGIAETVSRICFAELLHSVMSYYLIQATIEDGWGYVYDEIKPEMEEVYKNIVENELRWADYLFSGGREGGIVGLTKDMMYDQVFFFANNVYKMAGYDNPFKKVDEIAIKAFDKHVDRSAIQISPQELNNTSYFVNTVDNDLTDSTPLGFEGNLVF